MITRYEVDGRHYFVANNFAEYQGNTDREADSKIPAPVLCKTKNGHVKVKTNARPIQDPSAQRSMPDVDVDVDVDSEKNTGAQPAPDAPEMPTTPDPLKELAAVFEQASGIHLSSIPKKSQGALYWHPLKLMLETGNGAAAETVRAAIVKLRKAGMDVSGPNSILKTFNSIHGEKVSAPTTVFTEYR